MLHTHLRTILHVTVLKRSTQVPKNFMSEHHRHRQTGPSIISGVPVPGLKEEVPRSCRDKEAWFRSERLSIPSITL